MKLELEHLAPYLPYNLEILFEYRPFFKCYPNYFKTELLHPSNILIIGKKTYSVISSKPKLRPLSDLTKEIEVNGEKFVPYDYFYNDPENDWFDGNVWMNYMFEGNLEKTEIAFIPFYVIQKLAEWHFDIFGLIEKGLAVDINTQKQ